MTKKQGGASLPVTENYSRLFSNTTTVGTTPVALAATLQNAHVTVVQADPDNTGSVFVGNSARQDFELIGGQSVTIAVDVSMIYVRGSAAGQVVNWLAVG